MTPEEHDLLLAIHNVLLGTDGQGGLCRDFEKHKREDEIFRKGYYNFRLSVIITLCLFFGGSGFGFAKLLDLVR